MTESLPAFESLGLNAKLLKSLKAVGYERPSPIQAGSIPPLLDGRDVLGQAQTGTGKTAAFALPVLHRINLRVRAPQALGLVPTRELAIQVAEAFQRYAHHMPGFHVIPIYGGQGYESQIRALKRGVHVVVGTPGRVMDHMRKRTLRLDQLKHLILDEADEMLRMGFIDDVEWVLSQSPADRQIALFSATMPREIAHVAKNYLVDPVHIKTKVATSAAETIRQRYWSVAGLHKLDALTRILEIEPFEAMLIFVRTKTATVELAEKLEARGHSCAALNGDITQKLRERTLDRLKQGKIDILVATDVAARGLDVERISHVLNYDIPYDTEAYIHRIGRTGRAGRQGEAILFVAKREQRMLRAIEKATGKKIETMQMPSITDINQQRLTRFKEKITHTLEHADLAVYRSILEEYQKEQGVDPLDIAVAIALINDGDQPLFLEQKSPRKEPGKPVEQKRQNKQNDKRTGRKANKTPDIEMDTYRIELGHNDNVTPGHIVGAIANEAEIESRYIGQIKIHDAYSFVDLPSGMPKAVFKALRKVWVCQKQLQLSLVDKTNSPHKPRPGNEAGRKQKSRKTKKNRKN